MNNFLTIDGYVYGEEAAAQVAGILAGKGAWFEFEPRPDGIVCFRVKAEAGSEAVKTLDVHTAPKPEEAFPPYHIGRVLRLPVVRLLLEALADLRFHYEDYTLEDAARTVAQIKRLEEGLSGGVEETVAACREINVWKRTERTKPVRNDSDG